MATYESVCGGQEARRVQLALLCYRDALCRMVSMQAAFFAKWAADWVSVQGYDGTNNLPNTVSSSPMQLVFL